MKKYKPDYLGKVIPADNPSKLTDFVVNKFDGFNKIYDSCKDDSERISDIKPMPDDDALSVKLSTDNETLDNIAKRVDNDDSINISGDVITAR